VRRHDARQLHLPGVQGSVAVMRSPVAIVLLLALISLAPLALASPPDPIWIQGVFDAGDGDDAIIAATCTEGATDGAVLPEVAVLVVVGAVPASGSLSTPGSGHPICRGRAPPAA
jgi:hypothetical protein